MPRNTRASRKHAFAVATNQTSRTPRKCGRPISASFSAELAGTDALQSPVNLISASAVPHRKFRWNVRSTSTDPTCKIRGIVPIGLPSSSRHVLFRLAAGIARVRIRAARFLSPSGIPVTEGTQLPPCFPWFR